MGECAGEIVTRYQFEMTAAERLVFEAGLQLDRGEIQNGGETAYSAFLRAAKALVQVQYDDVSNDPDEILAEFKERFFRMRSSSTMPSSDRNSPTSFLPLTRRAGRGSPMAPPIIALPRRSSSSKPSTIAITSCARRRLRSRPSEHGTATPDR